MYAGHNRRVKKNLVYIIVHVLLHDHVAQSVPKGVVFPVEYKGHTCRVVWIIQRHLGESMQRLVEYSITKNSLFLISECPSPHAPVQLARDRARGRAVHVHVHVGDRVKFTA